MAGSTIESIAAEIARALRPLRPALDSPAAFTGMALRLGWRLDAIPAPIQALAADLIQLEQALEPFFGGSDPTAAEIESLIDAVRGLVDAISALSGATFAPALVVDSFATEFPERLIEFLVAEYVVRYHPSIAFTAKALGLIRDVFVPGTETRPAHLRRQISWLDIGQLLSDPTVLLQNAYGWGTPDFDGYELMSALSALFASIKLQVSLEELPEPKAARIEQAGTLPGRPLRWCLNAPIFHDRAGADIIKAGVRLLPLPASGSHWPGLAVMPYANGTFAKGFPLDDHLSFTLGGDLDLQGGVAIRIRPNAPIDIVTGFETGTPSFVKGTLSGRIVYADPSLKPQTLLGTSTGTRFEAVSVAGVGALRLDGTEPELSLEIEFSGARFVLAPGEGDSFLRSVLPPDGIAVKLDLAVGLSTTRGFYFRGSGSLEVTLPIDVQLGPIAVQSLRAAIIPSSSGFSVDVGLAVAATIGPVAAAIGGLGLRAAFAFPGHGGNLGPLDLALGFKPPDGIGLSLSTAVVSGGGYIAFDFAKQQYSGVLQLSIQNIIDIKAIGILNARLPDGRPGYSLLLIITGEFPPIQLGMGFTLNGLGGLLGINRTTDTDVLRAGLRDGAIDSIMFPPDPLGNVPALLGTLGAVFPVAEGRYVFGPMARIGWGTPTILTLDLALLLELPEPIRLIILGRLKLVLPDEAAPLIKIRMDAMGVLDFARCEFSLDATLYDSRVVTFEISGDMALRLSWGSRPDFLLSLGGFHPAFKPPPGFPVMRRLCLPLASGNNPRLRMEAYFAITSNTVQVGAKLEAYIGIAGFSLEGGLGFDTLIQFSPFRVRADIHAYLALKRGSTTLMGIDIDVHLTGPAPWVLWGKAKFKIFFISFGIPFRVSFGRSEEVPALERQDVWPVLRDALGAADSWSAQLPAKGSRLVVLRADAGDGEPLAHPLGTLTVSQHKVPLERTLGLFGAVPPKGHDRFEVASAAGLDVVGKTTEHFAPAQFRRMSNAEKLASPSFERMVSGARLAPTDAVALGHVQDTPLDYEQSIILDLDQPAAERLDERYAPAGAAVAALAEHGPAGTAEVRAQGRATFGTPDPGPAVGEPVYVVVTRDDLTPVAIDGLDGTYTSAAELLRHRPDRDALQIVRAEELELT